MIEIHDLNFGYTRETLFSALELSLGPGNICGLLGKNGAGKTTLLKLMAGLLFPKHGDIRILGHPPCDRSPLFLEELMLLQEEFSLPSISPAQYEGLYASGSLKHRGFICYQGCSFRCVFSAEQPV